MLVPSSIRFVCCVADDKKPKRNYSRTEEQNDMIAMMKLKR